MNNKTLEFIQQYYPNYEGSDAIAELLDLDMLITGDYESGGRLSELLDSEFEQNLELVQVCFDDILLVVYHTAIGCFMSRTINEQQADAMATLESHGQFVDNLFSVQDVQQQDPRVSDAQAQEILKGVFSDDEVNGEIQSAIQWRIDNLTLPTEEDGFPIHCTEDGHIKTPCPKCQLDEHIETIKDDGQCVTCSVGKPLFCINLDREISFEESESIDKKLQELNNEQ